MKDLLTKALYISALCFVMSQHTYAQQQKYALVIGAQNYTSLPPLRNSLTDARDLTSALMSKGFKVESLLDPRTKKEIKDAIIRYEQAMHDVVGGVGIIFYAGHGMQFEGNNYIIPTTAKLELSSDLEDQCLKMNAIMAVLNATNKSLNILFLDACRTIPSFNRDSEQGWTKVNAPRGSIIVFATEVGKVASDGDGKNGLFTSKLLNRINESGLNIAEVLKRVKQDVFAESNQKQLPTLEDNSIGGDFFFTPRLRHNHFATCYTINCKNRTCLCSPGNNCLRLWLWHSRCAHRYCGHASVASQEPECGPLCQWRPHTRSKNW